MRISVIIVTYNGWSLTRACLASLETQTRPPDEVIIVDNGSSDGTPDAIRASFPWATLIDTGCNLGFAAGNNLGIARSSGDAVVLVNSDVVVEPDFLTALVSPLERDLRLGAVASTMVFASAPEIVASAGIEVYRNGLALDRALGQRRRDLSRPRTVFGPSAGAAAYRRGALDDVGLFPEPFFMYLEDVDLAWRLRLRGWESLHAPGAVAHHAYSASSVEGSPFKRRLVARNRIWVLARCAPDWFLARNVGNVTLYEVMVVGYALAKRDWPALHGRLDALSGLRDRLSERRGIQRHATTSRERLETLIRPSPSPADVLEARRLTQRYAAAAEIAPRSGPAGLAL